MNVHLTLKLLQYAHFFTCALNYFDRRLFFLSRKQLAFLEFSLSQTEERMKEESEKVVNFYMEKINWLEEHHGLYKKWTEENMASIIGRHNDEKEMLRQQHIENVKVLQEHHTALMENIK